MNEKPRRRGQVIIFGQFLGEWSAPYPDAKGGSDYQASAYRALVLSADGIGKLRAIRRFMRDEKNAPRRQAKRRAGKGGAK